MKSLLRRSRFRALFSGIMLSLIAMAAWAAFAQVRFDSREELFTIPKGTWARRMAGDKIEILPSTIWLMTGVRNILVLQNLDEVPQTFGPVLIMPGQRFSLPFDLASDYQFACTAHASGQMAVIVEEMPAAGWHRLVWRLKSTARKLKQ